MIVIDIINSPNENIEITETKPKKENSFKEDFFKKKILRKQIIRIDGTIESE